MAWRNLWRRKRRTLITAFTVAFGVLLAVTFTGTGDYIYTNMIDTSARMGFGHITIEPAGYNDSPSLDKRLANTDEIRKRLLNISGVTRATIRIVGQGMFASATKSVGGVFIAIDPALESPDVNIFLDSLVEGAFFEGTKGRGVVVGAKVAEKLKLRLGRKLVYTTTDIHGEIVSAMARVTGIFKTGVVEVDGSMILLPIDTVRKTLDYGPQEATMVSVLINDQRYTNRMKKTIYAAVGNHQNEVLDWSETQADVAGLIAIDKSFNYLMQFLVGLLIAAGILNTMLMSVLERKHEFGVMMAIGMSPGYLFRLVLMESLWIGISGLLLGIVITTPWFYYLNTIGIDLTNYVESMGEYSAGGVLVDPVLKIRLFKESAFAILGAVFTLTMVAGLYPAFKAGRVPPVESLKTI